MLTSYSCMYLATVLSPQSVTRDARQQTKPTGPAAPEPDLVFPVANRTLYFCFPAAAKFPPWPFPETQLRVQDACCEASFHSRACGRLCPVPTRACPWACPPGPGPGPPPGSQPDPLGSSVGSISDQLSDTTTRRQKMLGVHKHTSCLRIRGGRVPPRAPLHLSHPSLTDPLGAAPSLLPSRAVHPSLHPPWGFHAPNVLHPHGHHPGPPPPPPAPWASSRGVLPSPHAPAPTLHSPQSDVFKQFGSRHLPA